ncbi:hypothetical protein ACLBOM_38445 [Escherichia coli]
MMKNRKARLLIANQGHLSVSQIGLLFAIDILVLGSRPLFVFTVSGETEAQPKTAGKITVCKGGAR